jgi:hypothetical protein
MINRRRFVQHSVAGSVIALVGGIPVLAGAATSELSRGRSGLSRDGLLGDGLLADGLSRDNPFKLHIAIFDRRFAAGRRFAKSSEAHGISTRAIAGEVTSLWYSELHPLWKAASKDRSVQHPVAIAGLTTYGPLFCLERLAWDHGMRVLHRQEHDTRDAAWDATRPDTRDVAPDHAWDSAQDVATDQARDAAPAGTPGEPDQILHTWIIAPRQRPPTRSV